MIITCPTCSTHYDVPPTAIGSGRSTRCSNCQNTWFQTPLAAAHQQQQQMMMMQQQLQQQQQIMQQQPMAPVAPVAPIAPAPTAQSIVAPQPIPAPAPAPPTPEPEPQNLGPSKLDDMFGEDDEDEGVSGVDFPDPDPIPEVFTAESNEDDDDFYDEDEDDEEHPDAKRFSARKIIVPIILLLLIGSTALVGFIAFGKSLIIERLPQAEQYYKTVEGWTDFGDFNLFPHDPTEDMSIRKVKPEHETEAGVEVLVIRGEIKNISTDMEDPASMIPPIKVSLFDAEEHEIQSVIINAIKDKIAPGETSGFKARLMEPSPLGRRIEVIFMEPEDEHGTPDEAPEDSHEKPADSHEAPASH